LNIDLSLEKQVFRQPFFRKTAEKVEIPKRPLEKHAFHQPFFRKTAEKVVEYRFIT